MKYNKNKKFILQFFFLFNSVENLQILIRTSGKIGCFVQWFMFLLTLFFL